MRVAVISDTHGNLFALDAVLADIDATGPFDEVVMAGDFAFGGPFPAECVARIRERGFRAVRGNTDEFIVEVATDGARPATGATEAQRHSPAQIATDRWAVERMTAEQIEYLAALPLSLTIPDERGEALTVVHATPWSSHDVLAPDAPDDLVAQVLDAAGTAALAYGHIHVAYERHLNGRLLAAVGSVSLPFDGDQRAAYAVFTRTADGWSVDLRRVAYDVDAAIEATLRSGMLNAEGFAATLRTAQRPGT